MVSSPASRLDDRTARSTWLARADATALNALADDLLGRFEPPLIVRAPEVGVVMMQVREPVCAERFHIGEVVVTQAEVDWGEATGWAMRLGTDRVATLSAALCDAAAEFDADAGAEVEALCAATRARLIRDRDEEWAALAATSVRFEELD